MLCTVEEVFNGKIGETKSWYIQCQHILKALGPSIPSRGAHKMAHEIYRASQSHLAQLFLCVRESSTFIINTEFLN